MSPEAINDSNTDGTKNGCLSDEREEIEDGRGNDGGGPHARVKKSVDKSGIESDNNREKKGAKGGRKKHRAKEKVVTVMRYELIEEKRDDGKRKKFETIAKKAEQVGYNMVEFDLMTEKDLDANYEMRTKTSSSQEFMGTGKDGIACAQRGAEEYRRNKGSGVCKICIVTVKPSKVVYQCTGIGCDEQRCLDCSNSLR